MGHELRVGIVGLGWAAGAHLEAFRQVQGATVTAVCSRRPLDRSELSARFGFELEVYQDYGRMLAEADLDVVDVCTPHRFHAEQAIAAVRTGRHVLIEKPIALTLADCDRVRAALAEAGVQACVAFECRFSMHFRLVRSLLEQGLLGELHYGEVDYYHGIGPWYAQFPWNVKRDGGGSSLLTAGCHALDALLFFFGGEVTEVSSYQTRSRSPLFAPYEYATTSSTLLRFADGRVGKCASVVDCLQPYYFRVHLCGSEGSVLDDRFYSRRLEGLDRARWSRLATATVDSGDVQDHPYLPQFQAFVDAVQEGRAMPFTDFETAWRTHRVLFAADQSAAEGRPVKLAPAG